MSKIPVVLVGVTRETALAATSIFEGTSYTAAAALDFVNSPEPYRFSPPNLGVVLNALHPRPRVLITGTAVDQETCGKIEPVWQEYAQRIGGESCWVELSKTHPTTGPPPPGIGEEVMRQLQAVFAAKK